MWKFRGKGQILRFGSKLLGSRRSGGTAVNLSRTKDNLMSEKSAKAFTFALQVAFVEHQLQV